jgi:hypothetical protein
MANTVSILSYANTFGDQMVATNALARENNDLAANNYVKRTGTLYLNDPTLGLQVANNSVFGGQLQVTGLGSSAYIQNNLRVDTQVYFTNTVLGLTNSGQAIIGGLLSANGSNVSLSVANNTQLGGYLNVSGNASVTGPTSMANTLAVTGPVTMANTLGVAGAVSMGSTLNVTNNGIFGNNLSVVNQTNTYSLFVNTNIASNTLNNTYNVWIGGTASVMGTLNANTLQANNVVNTALMIATDRVLANFISSNTTVTGNTFISKGFTYSNTLQVTTNSFTGNLNVQYATVGDSVIANTFMYSPIVSSTIVSATNIVYANYLQANSTVNAATSTVTGNSYTNILIGNTSVLTPIVSSTTINNSGINYTNVLQANTLANAATLTVSGAAYVNNVQANTNIYTPALTVVNTLFTNNIQANTNINTPLVTSTTVRNTGVILTDTLQANTSVNTSTVNTNTLSVIGQGYLNTLQANTNIVSGNATVTNSITGSNIRANNGISATTSSISGAEYVDTISANTSITVPVLNIGTSITACNASVTANTITVGTGGLSVIGNFTINGSTVYNAPTFTLSAATPNQTGYINVYRTTVANASIKWDQANTYWSIADVSAGANSYFYRILTTQQITDSALSTSTTTAASANVANALNSYVNTNVVSLQNQISSNSVSLQNQISSNVALIAGVDATQNTNITAVNNFAQSAYNKANTGSGTFNGTSGQAVANNGIITFQSTNGVTLTGTSNTLSVNTPQDVRTSASPTFNSLTLTNALPITQGGTGTTNATQALTNLLPAGEINGYVLATSGVGGYYWAAGGTGGGGGTTPGTTISSSLTNYTANGSGLSYSSPTYVPGADQLKVFVNGVRKLKSVDYNETSGNTGGVGIVTFTSSPASSAVVILEVDGYIVNPYYANNIPYTINGTIGTANTIQTAIDGLTSIVALSVSPTLTGKPLAPTAATANSDTQIATTAFVKNVLNATSTYAISTTGSAATLTTPRAINGVSFDGSAAITVTAAAGTLTGTTLNSTVVSSSLTSVGTITSGVWNGTTIAVLNGGTGTTTSTGTGSVVLSTSPTLVTPILGTPQSGNLSNCTFPTLNQNTTGNAATTSQTNFSNLTIASSQVLSAANFNSYSPTLTGTGASGTWGISITGSSAQLTGLVPQTSGVAPTANQILRADGNGYAWLGYINANTPNAENPTISQVLVTNGSDNYYRKSSISSFTSTIQSNASGTWGINISGNATTATSAGSATTATTATTANALNTGNSYSGTYFQTSSGYAAQFGGSAAVGFYLDATNSAVRAPTTGSIYMQSASGTSTYGVFSSSGLSVTGTITASSNITAYSDERIKCNWKDLSSTFVTDLAKVKSGTFERLDIEGTQVGVSAQSLQKVMPEAVVEDSDGTLSVAYGNAALAASVELAKEIVLMKEMIKQLHAEIEVLKSTK